jgi:hypothetical protein
VISGLPKDEWRARTQKNNRGHGELRPFLMQKKCKFVILWCGFVILRRSGSDLEATQREKQ